MRRLITFLSLVYLLSCVSEVAAQTPVTKKVGDLPGGMLRESGNRRAIRLLQYRPEEGGFVSVNGKNRFTRALYGSHSLFRIETSDRPVFATYNKKNNKHLSFRIIAGDKTIALDSTDYCKSVYFPGKRIYELKDKRLGTSMLKVEVNAFYDTEGGIWKFDGTGLASGVKLVCQITEIRSKHLNRNGDMGADPIDAFEAPLHPKDLKSFAIALGKEPVFVEFENSTLKIVDHEKGQMDFDKAEQARTKLAGTLKINTPDPYINTLGGTISMAADAIWDGNVWLHGAVGWRSQLPGWRAAYTGDMLGWPARSDIHFDNYAASQVTGVPPVYPQPQLDTSMNLARGAYRWGSPMYSNGYICRSPRDNHRMHHYDMNMVYIDELLTHLQWSGDLEYARKMFPVIKSSIEWEKRNWDADGDGLYDNYAGTWASDALGYNSGGTAVASAYNYRANKLAAEIAKLIGENPRPYGQEAEKIQKAMNDKLWLKDKGWWAEYVDFMGNQLTHPNAAVWSIYTPINSGVSTIFQAYQATRYIDAYIPHIPVMSNGFSGKDKYATLSTSSWLPYVWSVNNVAFGEVGNTALAYWQAGRPDAAFKLFKSSVLDGMYLGNSPGNIGQISFYDAALGETYRDFGDVIGVYSLDVVQGLFGIYPDALHNKLFIRPGFPSDWNFAEITQSRIGYKFKRSRDKDIYIVNSKFKDSLDLKLLVNAPKDQISGVTVNGRPVKWVIKDGINRPLIEISCGIAANYKVEINWSGNAIAAPVNVPNGVEQSFAKMNQGGLWWWKPVNPALWNQPDFSRNVLAGYDFTARHKYVQVNMDQVLNAKVTDIFTNKYLTPRSPYTTLQTPTQGVGDWCQPKLTYQIDDAGIRSKVQDHTFMTPMGIPFRLAARGNNIAFVTLWDNYPDSITVPLSGKAEMAVLLMTGTTNPMQYGIVNGLVRVHYKDGSTADLDLKNPDTWCPIQEVFFRDSMAFHVKTPRPYRVSFKKGIVSKDMGAAMGISPKNVGNREIKGGAGIILNIPLDKNKELSAIEWKAVANEVIVGMMAVTLVK
ncbi:DUF4450 domain-containing protein [Arachidicoccus terrestris]|nr:DUF4450 domain-containing protein [Arachidicoccus terrestris]